MKYLVFDVGGSSIKYSLMNEAIEFFEKGQVPTPMDKIEQFIEVIGSIFDQYKNAIDGIAISMPGRIDSEKGFAYSGGSLHYNDNQPIGELLQKRCPVPIIIENDGKCAALAEAWRGSLSDCQDGIVVILGTGIGGGIIKDKKLHKGNHFTAGEFSFILTDSSSLKEGKQQPEPWYKQAGSLGLLKPIAKLKNIPLKELDGHKVFEMANQGDEKVLQILDDYCYGLVIQLFNLQYIYDPEKIAIGGGISAQDILIEYIKKNVKKLADSLEDNIVVPEIVRCKFRNDANLIGALYNYIRHLKEI